MFFQIRFQIETLTTKTVERFLTTVQSNVSLQTDLPSECLPTDQHTKHFLPQCIIRWHIKYPLRVKGFWHVARVYGLSPVWILKLRLSAFWEIKRLLHIEHWWGWSLACILECLVKPLSVWSAQLMYGTNMVSLQYVFSRPYPNLDLFWRPPHIHSTRSYPLCVT